MFRQSSPILARPGSNLTDVNLLRTELINLVIEPEIGNLESYRRVSPSSAPLNHDGEILAGFVSALADRVVSDHDRTVACLHQGISCKMDPRTMELAGESRLAQSGLSFCPAISMGRRTDNFTVDSSDLRQNGFTQMEE